MKLLKLVMNNASYYNLASKWAKVKHRIYGNKLKNLIEKFIQAILKEECDYEHIL